MTKRAILYARVSTDEQAEKGYSLPTQLATMQKYAAENGYIVPEGYEISDDCSGSKLNRPGLDHMRAMIANHEVEAVIVFSLDRLTRNLAHSLLLREEWQRAGIELHYCNRGQSTNTPESRMTENIEAVFSDYWREKIIESSRRGKRAKAQAGKWVGNGEAPYGYNREGKGKDVKLSINEQEAIIIQWIFAMYTGAGGRQPMSMLGIAVALTKMGISTPARGGNGPGQGWRICTVRNLITRTAYIGKFRYSTHEIEIPELAIIDPVAFEVAQSRLQKNKTRSSRNRKRHYLLASHIRCSCGRRMHGGFMKHGGRSYYRCDGWSVGRHISNCKERYIRAEALDSLVWQWICGLLTDSTQLDAGLSRMFEKAGTELAQKRERLALMQELIVKTEQKVKRLVSVLGDADEMLVDTINAEIKIAQQQRQELTHEAEHLSSELAEDDLTPEQVERVKQIAAEIRQGLAEADFETKRYLLDRLNVMAQVRTDDTGRWLDLTCGFNLKVEDLQITSQSNPVAAPSLPLPFSIDLQSY